MKNLLAKTLTISALAFSAYSASAADKYVLDPTHTNITWQANHFGFSNPSGKFAKVEGTLLLDEAKPENSKVNVTVSVGSIITGLEKFDTHLKSKDFFNVDKFPNATFISDKVEVTGKDTAKVHGKLTMLGVTKPEILDVKLNKIGENPISKKKTAGFSASTTIKRSEYGMNYGIPGVSDEVKLMIESEAAM